MSGEYRRHRNPNLGRVRDVAARLAFARVNSVSAEGLEGAEQLSTSLLASTKQESRHAVPRHIVEQILSSALVRAEELADANNYSGSAA